MVNAGRAATGGGRRPMDPGPSFRLGMKVYDNDWHLRFGMSCTEVAEFLAAAGVSFVLAQSRYLPMPDTAIESAIPPELAEKYRAYDDRVFREALRRAGVAYVATCLVGFDPGAVAADPDLLPVDEQGRTAERIDWYLGIPPDRPRHVARRIAAVEHAVRELQPDAIHLAFMRWPGFWELWLPDNARTDFPDYCYSEQTLRRFSAATGIRLLTTNARDAAQWIRAHALPEWIDWKCGVVAGVVGSFRDAARAIRPDVLVALNTLPFGAGDYENAVETVFGQRFEQLAGVVDVFEVMAYHQILRRSPAWVAEIGQEVKRRTARTTVCTVQAQALYLEGMHAGAGRQREIGLREFAETVRHVEHSPIDGVVFFTLTDFLKQIHGSRDRSRFDILRSFRRGS
jgi:hypothetical protein